MTHYRPGKVLVEQQSLKDALTPEILSRLPGVEVESAVDIEDALRDIRAGSDPQASGKQILVLARNRGAFLKKCPGAGAEVCCGYYVLNFAFNCHFECTYCILQAYLNNPALIVCTNFEDMMAEVRERLSLAPNRTFRIGTGEMADSLALDDITRYSEMLVPAFAALPNGLLELKTKSDRIENLEGLNHRGHTVVSWSINTPAVIASEELSTPNLAERLSAVRRCQLWGYRIGFHFDPLIHYRDWERDYEETVREALGSIDHRAIAWISLGTLRFTPHLRDTLKRRFPMSSIPFGEFVPGHHGKLRYFRPIREEMYSKMLGWIRRYAPDIFVYLCMESRLVWERSLGYAPTGTASLCARLDACALEAAAQNEDGPRDLRPLDC